MPDYIDWDDLRRELGVDAWQAEHPWHYRRIRFRMWLRTWVWRLTRINIG